MFMQLSNFLLIIACGIILLFLLKSPKLSDKLWLTSVGGVLLIVLISITQIVFYTNLHQQLMDKEAALQTLTAEYAKMKLETKSAHSEFADAGKDVDLSRRELNELRDKVTTEFDRTIREIHAVYANISDAELNRRFNNAVRKARKNLQDKVFQ